MANIDENMKTCPLLSIGTGIDMVCSGEKCAWFIPNVKKCSMYLTGCNALVEANLRQRAAKKQG